MLIEVARQKGNYLPDLSFGTHFFQDLVEASIRYLPLYPDDAGNAFRESFLKQSHNVLEELATRIRAYCPKRCASSMSRERPMARCCVC